MSRKKNCLIVRANSVFKTVDFFGVALSPEEAKRVEKIAQSEMTAEEIEHSEEHDWLFNLLGSVEEDGRKVLSPKDYDLIFNLNYQLDLE